MEDAKGLKGALLWEKESKGRVRCKLCNFRCLIAEGKKGSCFVRQNIGGKLYSLNYNKVCAGSVDPIEKKPLFHFQPGSQSYSVACPGCNFKCSFCQNWRISQMPELDGAVKGQVFTPNQIVEAAIKAGCSSIAYTYTEPTIFMELAEETGRIARESGLKNVFVSNGYMTTEAIDMAGEWLDGINIDLKSFSEDFYKTFCRARLEPVLENIKYIAGNTDIWLEITTLIIPGENDSEDELKRIAEFIVTEAGEDVPWHISRFYPNFEFESSSATPVSTIEKAYEIAEQAGLKFVYQGNVPGSKAESSFCPDCGEILIERVGYNILQNKLLKGCCPECCCKISGIF